MPRRPVILVIEAHTELGHVFRDVLDDEGYDVIHVRDQFAALGHLREQPIDLVVSDLEREEPGDPDPLGEIIREFSELPLITVGDDESEDMPFFGPWRMNGHRVTLRKPFRLDDLVSAARELVG